MINRHKEIPKGDQIEIARRENSGRRCVDRGKGNAAGDRPRDQRRDDHRSVFQIGSKNLFIGLYFHTKLLGQHNTQRLIAGHHAGDDGCQQHAAKGHDLFLKGGTAPVPRQIPPARAFLSLPVPPYLFWYRVALLKICCRKSSPTKGCFFAFIRLTSCCRPQCPSSGSPWHGPTSHFR